MTGCYPSVAIVFTQKMCGGFPASIARRAPPPASRFTPISAHGRCGATEGRLRLQTHTEELMTQLKAVAATLAALTLAHPLHAQAPTDTRPTVAVMFFTDGAIGKEHETLAPLSGGIADMLITDLSVNEKIRVVERDNLKKLMDEQNLSAGGRVDQETAVKVGKLLGVHHMIFGGFVTDGRG